MTIDTNRIAGVVLAGGLSRRMGSDKTLMEIGGKTMLQLTIERLAPQVAAMAINANGAPERYRAMDLPVIPDMVGDHAGPLAGIVTAMRWAQGEGFNHVATVASDTPFFPKDFVSQCAAALRTQAHAIALASSFGNRHPVFGLWPVALADDLEQWISNGETMKVMAWVKQHEWVEVEFGPHGTMDPFFNANTPEQLDELRTLAGWSQS